MDGLIKNIQVKCFLKQEIDRKANLMVEMGIWGFEKMNIIFLSALRKKMLLKK
jgi:flagellar assembly factor FliW